MSGLKIVVFLGSTREGRQGEQVAKTITEMLKAKGHEVEIFDPLTLGGDGHVHQPLQFYKDLTKAPEWQRNANQKVVDAQGYVVVTCEYNCQLPPGLTSTMDQFPPASYRHKPCSIISYSMGPFGGVRAAALARPFLSEFGMITTPTSCTIPQIQDKFSEGKCTEDRVTKNMDKVVAELTWYGTAIAEKTKADGVPTPAPELY
ncbi:unnamed protein product [Meganyctiphanes norvegica]|uniref:NADPH-dependent FMN reductase-like domain-containing protein n=1 Tax=Meganyctiphanes norvegica TaxID=48144 RepID=A0AAV2PU05_MEGNR